jgi:uncharacterized cupredoxin-like copper-binding protein
LDKEQAEMSNDHEQDPTVRPVRGLRRPRRRAVQALATLGVVAVIAAGCGSTTAKTAVASTTKNSAAITATLTEFHIALSSLRLKAGTYTFHVVNAGHTVHNIEFNGPGVADKALTHNLNPGQSADLKLTLEAGRYDVFCPVGDHKQLGMNLELTVAGAPAKSGSSATNTAGSGY